MNHYHSRHHLQPKVTQADVARRAGVSRGIVSYVINNGPHPVAAKTRDRVLQAIAELGYQPNKHAQQLIREQGDAAAEKQFGLVLTDTSMLRRPYYGSILAGIHHTANRAEAAYKATRHLIAIGHQCIAYIGQEDNRVTGYRQACLESDLPPTLYFVAPRANMAAAVFRQQPHPTAMMAGCDEVAIGLLRSCYSPNSLCASPVVQNNDK